DLKSAADHYEQRYGVHPMAEANHKRVLVNRFCCFARLHVFDCYCAGGHSHLSGLQTIEFGVALIFPVAGLSQYMAHFEVGEVLCLLVANFSGNAQTQRSAVFAGQGPAVHFVAEQRLWMHGGCHVERLVIVIRAFDGHEAGSRDGANHLEEVGEAHPTEPANYVPSLDANMPCVLRELGQSLNLRESVMTRLLHLTSHRESPLAEIHLRIIDVVIINRELIERGQVGLTKCGRQMAGAEEPCRGPIAEAKTALKEWLLQFRDGKCAQRYHRCEFQQLTPADGFELAAVGS